MTAVETTEGDGGIGRDLGKRQRAGVKDWARYKGQAPMLVRATHFHGPSLLGSRLPFGSRTK
jgi:hypothetical protein